ncbi:hypothetical protein V498_10595 [Pseudogymnoascus sp. VKM F-4517 (FW-2822)]|nr:hypothetical protein V498_10595 [Pseudogymnoascus sp. VKM F-4517 (FW-2822)]
MSNPLSLQVDVGNLPFATFSALSSLVTALSADTTTLEAIEQTRALGSCYLSNGRWAAQLPDKLERHRLIYVGRLQAWVGWHKGDTAAYMSKSPGGRTASIICFALDNLYSEFACGAILHKLSSKLLIAEEQNSSPRHLATVSSNLAKKLKCLDWWGLFAEQVTRLRLQLFLINEVDKTDLPIPRDFAVTPVDEKMVEFLYYLHRALQDDNLTLHFSGSTGAGVFITLVLFMCPDDVHIEVENSVIHKGDRASIIFSICNSEDHGSNFYIESKIRNHTYDFQKRFIKIEESNGYIRDSTYSWSGCLSNNLNIVLVQSASQTSGLNLLPLQLAIANLIASVAATFTGRDWCSVDPPWNDNNPLPKKGLQTLLGSNYCQIICERLGTVLIEPTTFTDPRKCYTELYNELTLCLPLTKCRCSFCGKYEPWDSDHYPKRLSSPNPTKAWIMWNECDVTQLWAAIGTIVQTGILCLLVIPDKESNPSICIQKPSSPKPLLTGIWKRLHDRDTDIGVSDFHKGVLNLVDPSVIYTHPANDAEAAPPLLLCRSSESSTIFPMTLQYPRILDPWTGHYVLLDGKLHLKREKDSYRAITCTKAQLGASKALKRPKAEKKLIARNQPIERSVDGAHEMLVMTLRPCWIGDSQLLLLRSTISMSNKTFDVNFLDIHLGFLGLSPGSECGHNPRSPLEDNLANVFTTSVASPVPKAKAAIGLTLTHGNAEAQFLCCEVGSMALYQGDCCLTCSLKEAKDSGVRLIIGGSESY